VPLRHASTEYSEEYAELSNRQLLLNLARVSRNEPPYFIQLGQISSSYLFSGSVSLNAANFTRKADRVFGGGIGATAQEQPSYQFIPLTGTSFANALVAPFAKEIFYAFYDQGFHADILARTMLASVTVQGMTYVNTPQDPTYPMFLAFCHWLREAQQTRYLIVETEAAEGRYVYRDLRIGEVLSTLAAGCRVACDSSGTTYTVSQPDHVVFKRNPAFMEKPSLALTKEMAHTFQTVGHNEFFSGFAQEASTLKMRTFEAAMYAVGQEESDFRRAWQCPQKSRLPAGMTVANDDYGMYATVAISSASQESPLPKIRPLIAMTSSTSDQLAHMTKLIELDYKDATYTIGDCEDAHETENRSVFSLLAYLYTLVSIDPGKLPAQQLIHVQ